MSWQSKSAAVAIAIMAMSLHSSSVQAMPEQGKVVAGQGEIVRPDDKTMVINQKTDRLALDWQKFNIAKDEKVHFDQNSKSAIAINRVVGDGRSIIDGSLSATGNVFVINPNGVLFGKNSSVDVGGLVASTANVTDEDMRNFTQGKGDLGLQIAAGREASVINAGTIKAEGGLVALHATTVENTGTIANEGGTTALAAAKNLNIAADTAGKLNFTVNGSLANAKALNSGTLQSDGGYIVMTAKSAGDVMSTVVNNTGIIEAKTLHTNDKGEILLDGGASGQVEVSGTLNASGMEAGQSAGSIKVIGQKTIINDGTNLLARGTIDGGKIETSGDVLNLGDNLDIDAKGESGKAGEWLLDPLDVIISDADSDPRNSTNYASADKNTYDSTGFTNGNLSVGYNDLAATSSNATSVNTGVTWITTETIEGMLNAGTSVTIQAAATNGNANILVADNIDKTAGGEATLTLDAMRNITINGHIYSTSNKLNLVLNSDSNGDQIGAVIINADIKTNGGDFTSASGGSVTYTSDKESPKGYNKGTLGTGKADSAGHTVGTYFGHVDANGTADGARDNRLIQTDGGKITLNGEVAIGLNGGTLTLDSSSTDGTKGDIAVTGIINSGNSYGAYVYGTDTWNTLTAEKVNEYLTSGTVPAYHYQGVNYVKDGSGNYEKNKDGSYKYTTKTQNFSAGQPHYTFSEADTQNIRWLGDGSSTSVSNDKGDGYSSVIVTKGSMTLEQWLNYQLTYNKANFANRYISQSSGVKIVTEKAGNKTNTYVRNSDDSNVTADQFKNYLSTALANLKSDTASTDTTKMLNGETLYENLQDDIRHLLANNWFESKELAQGRTEGGVTVNNSYLATITTTLENSLTTPNGQQIMWVGGRGSGVLNKKNDQNNPYGYYGMPDDPLYQDGMYWVTGPEGEANNGKGTQFYSNEGSNWATKNYGKTVYGYANWDTYLDSDKKTIRSQPDNSSPFLTVGYGTTGKWDDAAMGGSTTLGFVKETNLANSNLTINAGGGKVTLKGDIGKAKALDTLKITSDAAVQIGDTSNDATKYHNGTVYVDHGLYIDGAGVKVGGEIHSGESEETGSGTILRDKDNNDITDSVTILSSGDIEVHGITANPYTARGATTAKGGKISLTSTGDSGKITLGAGVDYDGNATAGTIAAGSSDKGAVVIDSRGKTGAFINKTTSDKAIDTKGTWQVYVASPSDYGTVLKDKKDNLNSGTNAQWSSESTKHSATDDPDKNAAGKDIGTYTDNTHNKFIFQVTPTITVAGQNMTKTYGYTLLEKDLRNKLTITSATFTDSDNNKTTHSVDDYSGNFQEENDKSKYIASKLDATSTGMQNISVSSGAQAATATRTDGYKVPTGGTTRSTYLFTVGKDRAKGLNGYDIATKNADIDITKRTITINSEGQQTYGDGNINWIDTIDKLADGDKNSFSFERTIKADSEYAKNIKNKTEKGYTATTADAKNERYEDSIDYNKLMMSGKTYRDGTADPDFFNENYTLDTANSKGSIKVNPAILVVDTADGSRVYGDKAGVASDLQLDKAVSFHLKGSDAKTTNGDKEEDIFNALGLKVDSRALIRDKDGNPLKTNNVDENPGYDVTASFNQLPNYVVETGKVGKEKITPKDVYFHVTGNGKTLGDVVYTVTDTNPNPDYPLKPNDPINSQLIYGETVTPSYRPDGRLPNGHYGVSTTIDGRTVPDNGVYGNYRYHYDGDITVNMSSKPDLPTPVNPPVTPGTGTVTPLPEQPTNPSSNTPENTTETTGHKTVWDGERDRGGDRPEDKRVVTLPFFKVLEDKTTHRYGTYDVAKRTTEVKIEPSAQVLPEPNQPATQYRELTTELTTDKGTGEFTLKYNGSRFTILPDDDAAMKLIVVGDETKNRALFEKALHVAFTQMGLEVADLDGVYIHFGKD